MITCRTLDEIRIKTPSGIMNIPPGRIFNTTNINKALTLSKHCKIEIISSNNDDPLIKQSPQRPQCPQCEDCQGFPDADIEKQMSVMSANDQWNSPPLAFSKVTSDVRGWDPEMVLSLEWFKAAPRIKQPFHLEKHLYVCMPEKFYDSLERSIQAGPSGPRGMHGALLEDLKKLRQKIDGSNCL